MFKEHDNVIWGTTCSCGTENAILQNQFHPWNETDFIVTIKCSQCNENIEIDQLQAARFYNKRIYHNFSDVEGTTLDHGCGGGFLTEFLIELPRVNKVFAIDMDDSSKEAIDKLVDKGKNVEFTLLDIRDMAEKFKENSIDYIVSRDVFMFVEDPERYFDDITKIARKGIRQMGWYRHTSPRMKNTLSPFDIAEELKKRNWKVELEMLNWYKSGYMIKADR